MDLYSQCEFLGPRTLGFDSFFAFQGRYAIVNRRQFGQHQFNQVVGFRHLEELTEKVDSFSYRVLKKDCLDLPPKTYTVRYVSVTDEQAKLYNELRHDALTLLDNGN
jgi:SNF2 family DNA or RNA helicase